MTGTPTARQAATVSASASNPFAPCFSKKAALGLKQPANSAVASMTPRQKLAALLLETYGDEERAELIITNMVRNNRDIVGIYVMSSEARVPVSLLSKLPETENLVTIGHERTPFTEAALKDGRLDCVIAQNAGHLVRSAVRKLKAITDQRSTHRQQEHIRVEILLRTNL